MTLGRLWHRLRFQVGKVVSRSRYEREMADEMRLHLQREAEEQASRGVASQDAGWAALRRFGNVGLLEEECRTVRQVGVLENLWRDLSYGLRALRRTPTFTAVAILSLALGIGANTAIFSVVHAFLLTALPVSHPERLALLRVDRPAALLNGLMGKENYSFSYQLFDHLRQHHSNFSGLLAAGGHDFLQGTHEGSRIVPGVLVNGEYFRTLQVTPQAGRLVGAADDKRGGGSSGLVAVISDGFWTREFGRDPHALGHLLRLDGQDVTIVGVLPPSFHGVFVGEDPDVFAPLETEPIFDAPYDMVSCEGCTWLTVMARMKEGDNLLRLNGALESISRSAFSGVIVDSSWGSTHEEVLKNKLAAISGRTGYTYLRQRFAHPLAVLMTLALLVLLTACANLASLLLARSAVREREFSVRGALGASRMRLITQILTETLLLAFAGMVTGVPLAYGLAKYLAASLFARDHSFQLVLAPSVSVMLFGAAIMLMSCVAVGLTPALRLTSRRSPLMSGTRMIFSERGQRLVPRALLAGQVGLSLLLVTGAVLFSGTLFKLRETPLGFNPHGLMAMRSSSWTKSKKDNDEKLAVIQEALRRVRAVPGVSSAARAAIVPLAGSARSDTVRAPGWAGELQVWNNAVSPQYFATMQTAILEGRDFRDSAEDRKSAVILSRAIARKLFSKGSAVGRIVLYGNEKANSKRVVGVVEDSKYLTVRDNQSTLFSAAAEGATTFFIRYSGNAGATVRRVSEELRTVAPDVALETPIAMNKLVDDTLATERLLATLGNFFGALALLLMAIGLYGTLSYMTARRTPEIGVRMALGAGQGSVVWTVTRENIVVVSLGAVIGLGCVAGTVRYVQSFLYGVEMYDPALLLGATGLIGVVAAIATGLPALRAAGIDPMRALRCD